MTMRLDASFHVEKGHRVSRKRCALPLRQLHFRSRLHRTADRDGDDGDHGSGMHDVRREAAASATQLAVNDCRAERLAAAYALDDWKKHLLQRDLRRITAEREREQRPGVAHAEAVAGESENRGAGDR